MNKRSALVTLSFLALASLVALPVSADIATSPQLDADALRQISELQRRVDTRAMEHGEFAAVLYAPLRELGLAQKAAGDLAGAIDTFRRMQNLVHRIHGVYDHRQMESLDFIIGAYYQHGNPSDLDTQQHFRFRVAEKSFTPGSREYTHAKLKLADWYRNSGQLNQASDLYSDMLATTELQPELKVRLLRAEAMTRYLAGRSGASEKLHEALRLIEAEEASLVEPSQAMVDYMDMALMVRDDVVVIRSGLEPAFLGFERPKHVLELIAYQEVRRDPSTDTYINFGEREPDDPAIATVGFPVSMCGNTFDSLVGRDALPEFEVSLVIDDEGRPANISVNGAGPAKLKRFLRNSLQAGRFRPATNMDGEFTTATLSFRQTFGEITSGVGSLSAVQDWNKVMVAQTCQVSGVQRI